MNRFSVSLLRAPLFFRPTDVNATRSAAPSSDGGGTTAAVLPSANFIPASHFKYDLLPASPARSPMTPLSGARGGGNHAGPQATGLFRGSHAVPATVRPRPAPFRRRTRDLTTTVAHPGTCVEVATARWETVIMIPQSSAAVCSLSLFPVNEAKDDAKSEKIKYRPGPRMYF